MGIPTTLRMAGQKAALVHFFLYMHSVKQDNSEMAKSPNPHAQALGRLGGKARARKLPEAKIAEISSMGGQARAEQLSAAERSRIAKLAVAAREHKRKGGK